MDNSSSVKPEGPASGEDLNNEKAVYTANHIKIKIEPTSSGTEFETYNNTNIKVETSGSLQNEEQFFYKNHQSDIKYETTTSNYNVEMDSKISIKEELLTLGIELPNMEYLDCTNVAGILKGDKVTGSCKVQELVPEASSEKDMKFFLYGEEAISKTEIDCQSKSPSILNISQVNGHEENDLDTTEGLPSSESPRFSSVAVYHKSSHAIPNVCDVEPSSGNNVGEETSMRPNICSRNCNPAVDTQHLESVGNVGGENKQVYKCKVCEKKFNCQLNLNRHSLCHSQRKGFKCEHCDKHFTRKGNLQAHILVHSDTKAYQCEHCDKGFTQKGNLKKHILVHSGTKAFKCEHCNKCFTLKQNLKWHKLAHGGIKPYKCELCGKCFSRKCHLKQHALVHSDTKPYKCEYCQKCFKQQAGLQMHSLVHTGIEPYL